MIILELLDKTLFAFLSSVFSTCYELLFAKKVAFDDFDEKTEEEMKQHMSIISYNIYNNDE